MNNRSIGILDSSHILVALAGSMFALQPGGGRGDAQRESTAARAAIAELPAAAGPAASPRSTIQWTSSEYARAWKAVRNGKYTTRERIKLQRDLLARWADVDLRAAVEAALGEAWDRDGSPYYDPCGPLLDVFATALARNPQEGWSMIRGRQFGVASGMLRRVWMEAVGMRDPQFLARRMGELSWRDREQALEICHTAVQSGSGAATKNDLFKILAGFPDEIVTSAQLIKFANDQESPVVDLARMKEDIVRLADNDDRMAKVKAMVFGMALASLPADQIEEEIEGLPDGMREEAVWAAFKEAHKADSVLGLLDLLIEEEAWTRVEQRETVQQLQKVARGGDSQEVAEWATTLPVRKETTELFHRSIEPFLTENWGSAIDWLAELPTGTWRDRAYAEYSQVALNLHQNSRVSRWALNQINDPDFKDEAEGWRSQWEKRTGWTKN